MNIIIGIISYLPDAESLRRNRIDKLKVLIERCNYYFNIPIWVVAQNYKEDAAQFALPNVKLFHYDKLGITGARKQLRELFVNSDQDYLIMLDDDCGLRGLKEEGAKYLQTLENNPNKYGIKRAKLLKLLAISRHIYSQLEFPDVNPENNEGSEEAVFCRMLELLFPNDKITFTDGMREFSNSATDRNSTWRNEYKDTIDRQQLIKNTQDAIKKYTQPTEGDPSCKK